MVAGHPNKKKEAGNPKTRPLPIPIPMRGSMGVVEAYQDEDLSAVSVRGGVAYYRASGLGNCIRALVADGIGYEAAPDKEWLGRAAQEGQLHEKDVKKQLAKDWVVEQEQRTIQVEVVPGRAYITGHIDGVVLDRSAPVSMDMPERYLLEVKSMSRKVFDKWTAKGFDGFARYAYQLSAYMKALQLPALYVVKRRDDGFIDIQTFTEPPIPWKEVKAKVLLAEQWRRKGQLPPCDPDYEYRFGCPFRSLHEEEEEIEPIPHDEAEQAALEDLAKRYYDLSGQIKPLEEEKKEIGTEILELLELGKSRKVGAYKLTHVAQHREKVDKAMLRADLGDEADRYIEKYQVTFARVSEVGK